MAHNKIDQKYRHVLKKISNLIKMEQRMIFLSRCIKFKVTPETLKIKPPRNSACKNSTTWNNYTNLAKSSSLKNVSFAKKDVEISLKNEKTNFQNFMKIFLDELNHEEKKQVNNLLTRHSKKIHNFEKHKYDKKLNHLKLKNDIPIKTEPNIQGFECIKSKTRRFHKGLSIRNGRRKSA